MNCNDLKDILQALKDFDVGQVKLKMGELELDCTFNKALNTIKDIKPKLPFTNFPEAKYHASLQSTITEDELKELGFAGVAPSSNQKS